MELIAVRGSFSGISGYDRYGRAMVEALVVEGKANVKVSDHKRGAPDAILDDFWRHMLSEKALTKDDRPDVFIWNETPETYTPTTKGIHIASTMFETTGIPTVSRTYEEHPSYNWAYSLNKMHGLMVPSNFCARVFKSKGVTIPIAVTPAAYRPSEKTYDEKLQRDPSKPFTVASVFQWTPRKDPESLIYGFYGANLGKDARMLLKTYHTQTHAQDLSFLTAEITKMKNAFPQKPENVVKLYHNSMTDEEMRELYEEADVFLLPTRGEGICLPIVEAMEAYCVPIVPFGTAMRDYLNRSVAYPLPYCWTHVKHMHWVPWYFPDQDWMQVDSVGLKAQLEQAYKDCFEPVKHRGITTTVLGKKAMLARDKVCHYFSPASVAEKILNFISELKNGVR